MEDPPTRNHVVLELVEQLGMVGCIDQALEGTWHGDLLRRLKWGITWGRAQAGQIERYAKRPVRSIVSTRNVRNLRSR
jgi:hypothetical protein